MAKTRTGPGALQTDNKSRLVVRMCDEQERKDVKYCQNFAHHVLKNAFHTETKQTPIACSVVRTETRDTNARQSSRIEHDSDQSAKCALATGRCRATE